MDTITILAYAKKFWWVIAIVVIAVIVYFVT